jgi:hypothetical protein
VNDFPAVSTVAIVPAVVFSPADDFGLPAASAASEIVKIARAASVIAFFIIASCSDTRFVHSEMNPRGSLSVPET